MSSGFIINICTDPERCRGCATFIQKLRETELGRTAIHNRFSGGGSKSGDPFGGNLPRACATDEKGNVIGVSDMRSDEVAVIVHPDHQRKGVGAALVECVIQQNGDGTTQVVAQIDGDNRPSAGLFRRLGFIRGEKKDGYYQYRR